MMLAARLCALMRTDAMPRVFFDAAFCRIDAALITTIDLHADILTAMFSSLRDDDYAIFILITLIFC